jgi:hypothetical protein
MALTPEQLGDLLQTTLPLIKRTNWVDLSLEHQEYVSATLIDDKKIVEAGGPTISFRIQTKNTGNAKLTGLYATDSSKVDDVMITATCPWSMQTTNFSFDVNEAICQSDRETIIKEIIVREHEAMNSMAELMEDCLWNAPTATTDTRPMGIPFWVQKSTTTAAGGFTGGNPSGFTAGCGGVSTTDYPRWKNWSFNYTNVTTDDLVKKVKKSLAYTNFKAPVPHPELAYGKSDYNIYTTYDVVEALERLAETRNDNLGNDVAKYIGQVTIGGTPCKWVPYLTANDTSAPLYGLNWKAFRPYVQKGNNMRRNSPITPAGQHNVRTVHIDNTMNYICINRRLCWVGYVA